ncbi:hypothetical protein GE21DRAFT_1355015 [Neurospora crassa]|nr:hypothetical protein GE21DRAFT_1355015 [Neurospora crassa]
MLVEGEVIFECLLCSRCFALPFPVLNPLSRMSPGQPKKDIFELVTRRSGASTEAQGKGFEVNDPTEKIAPGKKRRGRRIADVSSCLCTEGKLLNPWERQNGVLSLVMTIANWQPQMILVQWIPFHVW